MANGAWILKTPTINTPLGHTHSDSFIRSPCHVTHLSLDLLALLASLCNDSSSCPASLFFTDIVPTARNGTRSKARSSQLWAWIQFQLRIPLFQEHFVLHYPCDLHCISALASHHRNDKQDKTMRDRISYDDWAWWQQASDQGVAAPVCLSLNRNL